MIGGGGNGGISSAGKSNSLLSADERKRLMQDGESWTEVSPLTSGSRFSVFLFFCFIILFYFLVVVFVRLVICVLVFRRTICRYKQQTSPPFFRIILYRCVLVIKWECVWVCTCKFFVVNFVFARLLYAFVCLALYIHYRWFDCVSVKIIFVFCSPSI